MANANFTASINNSDEKLFNAHQLLSRASGIVDLLFTMSEGNKIEELCNGTLTNSLDAIYFLLEETKKLITDAEPSQAEVHHV